jgi:hypothetical protein
MSFDLPEEDDFAPQPPPAEVPRVLARTLPHSIEAEESHLSLCLMDGADMVERSLEAHISPSTYYDYKHGVIFEVICDLYTRKHPIAVDTVAEELKTRKQFDAIGGYAFLTQVTNRVPTTAQAAYFIEKVREHALLRDIIRSATGQVEDCYGFSGNIEEFVQQSRDRMENVFDGVASAAAQANACKFDPKAKIVDERIAYWLGDTPLCTAGNLTDITAQSGVGKSAVIDAMIAATIKHPRDEQRDCLGFRAANERGLPVLHFDTEQSMSHYQRLLHRSRRRAGVDEFPSWFSSYHLTGKSPIESREIVRSTVKAMWRKFGGVYSIFIDGWGDLCMDPNDSQEAFPFVTEMHAMAIRYDCPIIGVLHLNPGMESKARGHLGSQLERKCETVLKLEMDQDLVTALYSSKKRGAPILKSDGPRFAWDKVAEMHTTVGDWQARAAAAREAKKAAKKKENPGGFTDKYSREEQVSFYPAANAKPEGRAVIFRRAQEMSQISPAQLERLRLGFLKEGWIIAVDGQYRRTADGDLWAQRRPKPQPKEGLPIEL